MVTEKTLCILPCAGKGSRMNMKHNESKEMLPDPKTGKPLIQYSLDLCKKYDLQPLIITRPQKTDLIKYVLENTDADMLFVDGGGEWAETVLKSEYKWHTHNILMLPDTRFEPEDIIEKIKKSMSNHNSIVFGVHTIEIQIPWGIVQRNFEVYTTLEKPIKQYSAWGLIGFQKVRGKMLLESYKTKNNYYPLDGRMTDIVILDKFIDITRTGKLEDY